MQRKIFLGGTSGTTTWRDTLILELERLGLEYFNPIVKEWNTSAREEEERQKDLSDILLYYITPDQKGFYSIAELTYDTLMRKDAITVLGIEISDLDSQILRSLEAIAELLKPHGLKVFYVECLEEKADRIAEYLYQLYN